MRTPWTGPPELFAIYFAAFVVIGSVISDSILKGLASASLGVVIAMFGLEPITSQDRLTFSFFQLSPGVPLVPIIIGMFVFAEVFAQLERRGAAIETFQDPLRDERARNRLTWAEYRPCLPHVFRSSLIGAFIGMLPGLGSSIAAFISYGEGKRRAANADEWGRGLLEGAAAPEAANNAVSGPSMAPLLTLGIPGSTIAATDSRRSFRWRRQCRIPSWRMALTVLKVRHERSNSIFLEGKFRV